MPFHAAEQQSEKQKNDSAERSDIPRRLLFASSAGQSAKGGPSERLPFLFCSFSFGQAKKKDI
jgi:hypothetical protein